MGNTDPFLVLTSVKILKEICQVNDDKIVYGLQLFTDVDEQVAVDYWMRLLNIKRSRILPTVNSINSGKIGSYKTKNEHGVITVYVNNMKLRN